MRLDYSNDEPESEEKPGFVHEAVESVKKTISDIKNNGVYDAMLLYIMTPMVLTIGTWELIASSLENRSKEDAETPTLSDQQTPRSAGKWQGANRATKAAIQEYQQAHTR